MRTLTAVILGIFLLATGTALCQEVPQIDFHTYLGLAVPYPDSIPEIQMSGPTGSRLRDSVVSVSMIVTGEGTVDSIVFDPGDAKYVGLVEDRLKQTRFEFTEGRAWEAFVVVPVHIIYSSVPGGLFSIRIEFPVSSEVKSDRELLETFFAVNGVVPPRVRSVPEMFFRPDTSEAGAGYPVITAQVSFGETGEVTAVGFPIPGQDAMTHAVLTALINAEFEPPTMDSKPLEADILLTFRIYDNLEYPFSPTAPVDSSAERKISERYFMTQFYNPGDIMLPPVPRNYGTGLIRSGKLGRQAYGQVIVNLTVDTLGSVGRMSILRGGQVDIEVIKGLVRAIRWYPAINVEGKRREFTGKLTLFLSRSAKVVFIPEWLDE